MTFSPNVLHLKEEQIIAGAAVSGVTFSNLKLDTAGVGTYDDRAYRIYANIKNTSGVAVGYSIYFGADFVVNHYWYQVVRGVGGAVLAGRGNSSSLSDQLIANNDFFSFVIDITYDNINNLPVYFLNGLLSNDGTIQLVTIAGQQVAGVTPTLDQIDIQSKDGGGVLRNGIDIGSQFRLFKIATV